MADANDVQGVAMRTYRNRGKKTATNAVNAPADAEGEGTATRRKRRRAVPEAGVADDVNTDRMQRTELTVEEEQNLIKLKNYETCYSRQVDAAPPTGSVLKSGAEVRRTSKTQGNETAPKPAHRGGQRQSVGDGVNRRPKVRRGRKSAAVETVRLSITSPGTRIDVLVNSPIKRTGLKRVPPCRRAEVLVSASDGEDSDDGCVRPRSSVRGSANVDGFEDSRRKSSAAQHEQASGKAMEPTFAGVESGAGDRQNSECGVQVNIATTPPPSGGKTPAPSSRTANRSVLGVVRSLAATMSTASGGAGPSRRTASGEARLSRTVATWNRVNGDAVNAELSGGVQSPSPNAVVPAFASLWEEPDVHAEIQAPAPTTAGEVLTRSADGEGGAPTTVHTGGILPERVEADKVLLRGPAEQDRIERRTGVIFALPSPVRSGSAIQSRQAAASEQRHPCASQVMPSTSTPPSSGAAKSLFSPLQELQSCDPSQALPTSPTSPAAVQSPPEMPSEYETEVDPPSPEDLQRQLDIILARMPDNHKAKYLKQKASDMLKGEKVRRRGVDTTGPAAEKAAEKEAGKTSKGNRVSQKKREQKEREEQLDRQTRQEIEDVDREMKELAEKKERLVNGKQGGNSVVPSPRESCKGNPAGTSSQGVENSKVKKVSGKLSGVSSLHNRKPDANEGISYSDRHEIGVWDAVVNVPPVEVDVLNRPTGKFWEHMRSYCFERASWIFKWHLPWPQQDPEMKRLFRERLETLYPGSWDKDFVMEEVSTNIRQRRVRCRNHMKRHGTKTFTPIAHGLTIESWNKIWESVSNPTYIEKSSKCKVAADKRTRKLGFTHKLGPGGVARLVERFVAEFHRPPTDEETYVAKREGVPALLERTRNRRSRVTRSQGRISGRNTGRGRKDLTEAPSWLSGSVDESSARTSSSGEERDRVAPERRNRRESGKISEINGDNNDDEDVSESEDGDEGHVGSGENGSDSEEGSGSEEISEDLQTSSEERIPGVSRFDDGCRL